MRAAAHRQIVGRTGETKNINHSHGDDELWLGEGGLLRVAGYVVLGVALFLWMRRRGPSWQALARDALTASTTE